LGERVRFAGVGIGITLSNFTHLGLIHPLANSLNEETKTKQRTTSTRIRIGAVHENHPAWLLAQAERERAKKSSVKIRK
jgi:hypothetical protein